jgi:integrase
MKEWKQTADKKEVRVKQHNLQRKQGSLVQSHQFLKQLILCPQCQSKSFFKDGFRYTNMGGIQRFLCRDCGFRFSNNPYKQCQTKRIHQLCVLEAKKLDSQTEIKTVAGKENQTLNGKIVDFAWQLKKRGLAETTIKQRVYRLRQLVKKGAELTNPETISSILATSNWSESNKRVYIVTYKSFVQTFKLEWEPPKTRVEQKIPFIPTETEIDQLIAGCGRKLAIFLQVLKDTAARTSEATKIKWLDIDKNRNTISINNPIKGSRARIVKVHSKTIAMISLLRQKNEYLFNPNPHSTRQNYYKQRKRLAVELQNPRIRAIKFHTFRHWKATKEYHKTKDILHVTRLLGHKNIKNTII